MIKKKSIMVIAVGLFAMSCNGPTVMFPEADETAVVAGVVQPAGSKAMVYIGDTEIRDSARCDFETGSFRFNNIPFGVYGLTIKAQGFGTAKSLITINYKVESLGTITLSKLPSQVSRVYPLDSASVHRTGISSSDTSVTVDIYFAEKMDTASVREALSFSSFLKDVIFDWNLFSTYAPGERLTLRIPSIFFFSGSSVRITLDKSAKTVFGSNLDFDLNLTYFPEMSDLPALVSRTFFYNSNPRDNQKNVDIAVSPEFTFSTDMLQSSVEKAFSIEPSAKANFFWSRSDFDLRMVLTVRFAEYLDYNTLYTVTFDSGMMREDSLYTPVPVTFTLTTKPMQFRNFTPLSGRKDFPIDSPFVYTGEFNVDTADFRDAFSISPQVDSLWFFAFEDYAGYHTVVYHSLLKCSTEYKITVDSTLKDVNGGRIGTSLIYNFTTSIDTALKPVKPELLLIESLSPQDTLNLISTSQDLRITFNRPDMDQGSVESRLTLTPSVPFSVIWYQTTLSTVCTIRPLQFYRSATLYTVILDSGYLAGESTKGERFSFQFKTLPLMLTSFSPVDGQINVTCTELIHLTFNSPVDPSSLAASIKLQPYVDSLVVVPSGSYSANVRDYSIRHAALQSDTVYTLTIQGTLNDIYGVSMGEDFTIKFGTGE